MSAGRPRKGVWHVALFRTHGADKGPQRRRSAASHITALGINRTAARKSQSMAAGASVCRAARVADDSGIPSAGVLGGYLAMVGICKLLLLLLLALPLLLLL